MQMTFKSNLLTVVLRLFTYSILFDCYQVSTISHVQPATFLVQPPSSNHSETPAGVLQQNPNNNCVVPNFAYCHTEMVKKPNHAAIVNR
jgi:hypothetical protein